MTADSSLCILPMLFAKLDILVLRYEDSSVPMFEIVGTPPPFLSAFVKDHGNRLSEATLTDTFPFLENYLIDAKQTCWRNPEEGTEPAIWSEVDCNGNELLFEVGAFRVGEHALLMIHGNQPRLREKEHLFQVARTGELAYARFQQEAQKQDILFHCIVHDLATPLSTASGSLQLLAKENLPEQAMQLVKACQRAVARQESLVEDVLDVFRADRGVDSGSPVSQTANVRSCVDVTVALLAPKAAWRRVSVLVESSTAEPLFVAGERTRLERVITNLLDNALRYAPFSTTVIVSIREEPSSVLVCVDDEGPGVSAALGATLFDKFGRDRKNSGKVGLGLYFCRITIAKWGGEIGHSPREGKGARFWFRLPKRTP